MSYDGLWAVAPCIVLGFFCGLASYFSNFMHDENYKPSKRKLIASSMTSAILSFIIFALLDKTDFSFMNKLAFSSAVAFLGIDKALSVIERILNLHKGGGRQ